MQNTTESIQQAVAGADNSRTGLYKLCQPLFSNKTMKSRRLDNYRQVDNDDHKSCPQARHSQSQKGSQRGRSDRMYSEVLKGSGQKQKNTTHSYSVPTSNYFNPLNY